MKNLNTKKILITSVLSIIIMLIGGVIGLQYFQGPFIEFKSTIKLVLGIHNEMLEVEEKIYLPITVNGHQLEIEETLATLTWLDTKQLTTEVSNIIKVGEIPSYDVYINGELVEQNSSNNVKLSELSKAIGIEVKLINKQTTEAKVHYIRTLPSQYNNIVSGEGSSEGYYYFSLREECAIYKMDYKGNIVFYKILENRVYDFKLHELNNQIYYTYLEKITDNDVHKALEGVGYAQVKAVVMDAAYEVVEEIKYMSSEGKLDENHSLENHEVLMLDVGHYIISAYVGKEVDNVKAGESSSVVACIIQEIKDGELKFEFDMSDYPEFYEASVEKNDFTNEVLPYADYAHLNSIDIDPTDNNLIISFRNLNTVVKVDRVNGEIIWILGGTLDQFGLTEEQKFSRQHFAKLSDNGILTIFDNGNESQQTRVVEYNLDEQDMKLISFYEGKIDGTWSETLGSAIRLDDTENLFLMGWGRRSNDGALFSEINFDTEEVFLEVRYIYGDVASYRTYKFDR